MKINALTASSNYATKTALCDVKTRTFVKRHIVFVKINLEINVITEILEIQPTAHTLVRSIHLPVQNIMGV
jgi:DNA-directed RNA polymerase subunit F